jgi:hypothetical protein
MRKHKCYKCGNLQSKEWQFCHECLTNLYSSGVAIPFVNTPNFVSLQKSLLSKHGGKMDSKTEMKMQDMIETAKTNELKNSESARSWERGRKKDWAAMKPYWKRNGNHF